jgi:hypothetical protein
MLEVLYLRCLAQNLGKLLLLQLLRTTPLPTDMKLRHSRWTSLVQVHTITHGRAETNNQDSHLPPFWVLSSQVQVLTLPGGWLRDFRQCTYPLQVRIFLFKVGQCSDLDIEEIR